MRGRGEPASPVQTVAAGQAMWRMFPRPASRPLNPGLWTIPCRRRERRGTGMEHCPSLAWHDEKVIEESRSVWRKDRIWMESRLA